MSKNTGRSLGSNHHEVDYGPHPQNPFFGSPYPDMADDILSLAVLPRLSVLNLFNQIQENEWRHLNRQIWVLLLDQHLKISHRMNHNNSHNYSRRLQFQLCLHIKNTRQAFVGE